ncbi:GL21599 [Drosophila persimilis]|uniref:GL21599 n=1 Tax=Drosophila persimilis TaxID=7234 RepID=B4GFN1_DROPE|nr:probable plastidic glucose transporter 2 [Drosophila persimilis]EDW34416.1 GL21599 [Drosophila persimilis]
MSTTTYVTAVPVTNYVPGQQTQTTYITTGRAPPPPPPNVVNVVVVNQGSRWSKTATKTGTAATFAFVYAGMDMAQGLGWNLNANVPTTTEFQFSWFIGFIIGALVSAVAVSFLPKKIFYGLGSIMNLIDAIIFVSAPYEYEPILAARYVGGVGIGLITVPFIIHSAEISTSNSRGTCSALEQYGLSLGIAIQVIYDSQWAGDLGMAVNRVHGIFGIVFSAFAIGSVAMAIESPIFYIRQNQEDRARASIRQLMDSWWTVERGNKAYEEAKLYVVEGTSQNVGEQIAESMMPFIKMLFFRGFVAFTISLPLSWSIETSTYMFENTFYAWPSIVFGALRLLGSLITMAVLDTVGRKFVSLLALMCMAGLMLGMAGIYGDYSNILSPYYMRQVANLGMGFQLFAGVYVCSSSAYLGEAFPLRVKPFLIGLIVCVEQVIHIVVIATFGSISAEYFYKYFVVVGILLVVGLVAFAILMPETRGTTLRKAGERFRRVHDVMAY